MACADESLYMPFCIVRVIHCDCYITVIKEDDKEKGVMNMRAIENVLFISVWNGGFEVTTNAKFNTKNGLVFDIEKSNIEVDDDGDELEIFEGQFIELTDGKRLKVEEVGFEYYVNV